MLVEKSQVIDSIRQAKSIDIYPHANPDGDALGSSAALACALNKIGKNVSIIVDDDVPDNLQFLIEEYKNNCPSRDADTAILVDCAEFERLEKRGSYAQSIATTLCIDHHRTSQAICSYNWIEPDAAATAEIVYDLIKDLEIEIDRSIAEAIYTGIISDTGRFQYSNTREKSFKIASELFPLIDTNNISIRLFQSDTVEKVRLRSQVLAGMEIFLGGRAVIASMTIDLLERIGAREEDSEGIVEELRNIRGIELAILLKEKENGTCKVSMRSKEYVDVAEISQQHGGGGHMRAAGFNSDSNCTALKSYMMEFVERWMA